MASRPKEWSPVVLLTSVASLIAVVPHGSSGATVRAMCSPVAVPPVNEMALMPGCVSMASPVVAPLPCTMFNTPGGMPALIHSSENSQAVMGGQLLDTGTQIPDHESSV